MQKQMGVISYKIFRDIWKNGGRTIQVVLIIAIGAASIGMILSTRNLVIGGMQEIWQSMHPAMINLFINPPISENEIDALKTTKGVTEIEGLSNTTIEWRLNTNEEWKPGGLSAKANYEEQKLNKLELVDGNWPTGDVIASGQDNQTFFGIPPNSHVYLRVDDREYEFTIGGTIYNQLAPPAYFGGTAQFYATPESYEIMVGNFDFSQVLVRAAKYDEKAIAELADQLQDKLKKQDKDSYRFITDPNKHFFQDQLDGIFFLLGALGFLSLALGLLLVYNTINGIILQQANQIGIMKAIGARTWQILRLYLAMIFIYSLMALLVSLPIGVIGGWAIASYLIGSFGADPGAFTISSQSVIVQALIAFLAPLLTSLIPILSASRVTVREAISAYGLSTDNSVIERTLSKAKNASRMLIMTISNAFQHNRRVLLLQIALVLSGLMFMMVVSVRDSVAYTIRDVMFAILNADITMVFDDPQRISHLEQITQNYPSIKAVEMWGSANATIRSADKEYSEDDESVFVLGVPIPTNLYGYQIRAGRWLEQTDDHAVVLNQKLAEDAGVSVGDWVTLKYGDKKESKWLVVGLIFDPILTTSANVPREVLLRDISEVGRASSVWIQTITENPNEQITIAKDLREYYKKNRIEVSAQRGFFGIGGDTTYETANQFINQFNFLLVLLGIMAVIIGTVGSIALSGALSLSVMERSREIGVMRAIGASSWSIIRLFVGEGLIQGWLSWLIALPISIPAGQGMVYALGKAFQLDIIYRYTPMGAILWLLLITTLSILASWLPARGASRISVRESLAYQ